MRNPVNVVLVCAALAFVMIAGASVYSAWVSSQNHHSACNRSDGVLDAVEQVLTLVTTPQAGKTYTALQAKSIIAFQAQATAILDAKRC